MTNANGAGISVLCTNLGELPRLNRRLCSSNFGLYLNKKIPNAVIGLNELGVPIEATA